MIVATCTPDAAAATLPARSAAASRWQVVVVGAGPAGAAVAWRLAARGIRTLLVDRHPFPRAKVCGSCLSPLALREFAVLGADALPEAALPLDVVRLAHRGRAVAIRWSRGRVVSRTLLDAHLVERAVAAGCDWLPGIEVTAIDDDMGAGTATVTGFIPGTAAEPDATHAFRADLVVLAAGLAGRVRIAGAAADAIGHDPRSRVGVGGVLPAGACALPAGELVMAVADGGYCGLVRLEDGGIDVAAALDRALLGRAGGVGRALAHLLDEACGQEADWRPARDALVAARYRATPPLTRRAPPVAGRSRRILRVGDAAGYVEPFTGEGIGWALASARLLAESVAAPGAFADPAAAVTCYEAAHHRLFARLHRRCRLVAAAVRRRSVVATAVAAARTMPWAARIIAPTVVGGGPGGDR